MRHALVLPIVLALSLAGCNLDDDEADLAGLVATQFVPLGVDTGDVDGATLRATSVVTPTSWLIAVKNQFGRAPERVELASISLRVNTPMVEDWSYLWPGEVTVAFIPASSQTRVIVARGTPPASFGTFKPSLSVSHDTLDISPDFAAGDFSVEVSGATSRAGSDNFSQQVVMELQFLVF